LKAHYSPKPSIIVQRFKFHTRFRRPGESVSMFLAELWALAQHCNFGATLDDMLRDRIVCGINDDSIQRRLLSEAELTLKEALKLALSYESATRNARELQASQNSGPEEAASELADCQLHRITSAAGQQQRENSGCSRCGRGTHTSGDCPFKEAECFNCGKKGHIRSACRSRPQKMGKRGCRDPQIKQVASRGETPDVDSHAEQDLSQGKTERRGELMELLGDPLIITAPQSMTCSRSRRRKWGHWRCS